MPVRKSVLLAVAFAACCRDRRFRVCRLAELRDGASARGRAAQRSPGSRKRTGLDSRECLSHGILTRDYLLDPDPSHARSTPTSS